MRLFLMTVLGGLIIGPALADDLRVALDIGQLVGLQEGCGYDLDPDKVETYVTTQVAAGNLQFNRAYQNAIYAHQKDLERASKIERRVVCAQALRNAKALNLLK